MTVDSIKKRIALFEQFDQTMGKLFEELNSFHKESKIVIRQESESIKLYGLAFNFAWTLRNSIEICQKYEAAIKNSLLHERFKHNKDLSDDFEYAVDEIVPYIENIIDTICVTIDDNDRVEVINEKDDNERLLSDIEYLSELSKDLTKNGNKILNIVCFYLRHISKLLINTKTVRANMTDNEYRFLFEREFKEYLSTDQWNDVQNSFIDRTINHRYHGKEPSQEQLYDLLALEIERIEEMSEDFGIIEPYLNDYTKLSRIIVQREFRNEINTPVLDLFFHLGRKMIIEKWHQQLEEERLCYVPETEDTEVTYSERFTENICKQIMPDILNLFEGRDAMDLVCFYHVLVFYNYIACNDFNVFNRWLTRVAEKELISPNNARKIKMTYWVSEAKKLWTKQGALAETNTAQQETKFRNYTNLCNSIRVIINNAKRVNS
jgi:hypothetical protein